jgi:hypothetical protein
MDLLTSFLSKYFDLDLLKEFEKIYVLVSGGIDSTLLAHVIMQKYPTKTFFVNCYNPYEQSKTLDWYKLQSNFIEIKNSGGLDYKQILTESFKKLPQAFENKRRKKKYEKKMFKCCKYIKHNAFKKDPMFQLPGTVVIDGIKSGDSQTRGWFLKDLREGNQANYYSKVKVGFFHRHKEGQLYCYPFRDYYHREFPSKIMKRLRRYYPGLAHSGCAICPVLVLFDIKSEGKRYWDSLKFWHKLNGQKTLFC